MTVDKENTNPAYLCGRLFAILEQIQKQTNKNLNRTINDAYFASAASRPSQVMPRLVILAQNHLKKIDAPSFWDKKIGEISLMLGTEYPDMLSIDDQGRFVLGYYQEKYASFEKKQSTDETSEEGK